MDLDNIKQKGETSNFENESNGKETSEKYGAHSRSDFFLLKQPL